MTKGVLIAAFDFSTMAADEFHDWYDTEHLPERRSVPGFLNGERWVATENANHAVATYDLESLGVMRSPAYLAVGYDHLSPWSRRVTTRARRLLRFEGDQWRPGDRTAPAAANGLLVVGLNVAPEAEAEFNEWYDQEHLPNLAAVPGVLCARRFRAVADSRDCSHKYTALYHLEAPEIVDSASWKTAAGTPWTMRLREHFRDRLFLLCRPYRRA
jgi:hypothetical protein